MSRSTNFMCVTRMKKVIDVRARKCLIQQIDEEVRSFSRN